MQIPFLKDKMIDFGFLNIPVLFFIVLATVNGIKTLAGCTLKRRKPKSAPATAPVTGSIPLLVPTAATEKKVATITVTLPASPSSPSVRLVPFTVLRLCAEAAAFYPYSGNYLSDRSLFRDFAGSLF